MMIQDPKETEVDCAIREVLEATSESLQFTHLQVCYCFFFVFRVAVCGAVWNCSRNYMYYY